MVMLSGHELAMQLTNHIQITRQINPKKLQHEKKDAEEFRFRIFTKVTEHGPAREDKPKNEAQNGERHAINEPEVKKENIVVVDDDAVNEPELINENIVVVDDAINEPEVKKENIVVVDDDAVKDVILGNVESSLTFFTPKRFFIDVTEEEQELSTTFFSFKRYTIEIVNVHENVQHVWCERDVGVVEVSEDFYSRKIFHIGTVCEENEWEREWIGKNRQCCLL